MQAQLASTNDIVAEFESAPATREEVMQRRLALHCESAPSLSSAEYHPQGPLCSPLQRMLARHLDPHGLDDLERDEEAANTANAPLPKQGDAALEYDNYDMSGVDDQPAVDIGEDLGGFAPPLTEQDYDYDYDGGASMTTAADAGSYVDEVPVGSVATVTTANDVSALDAEPSLVDGGSPEYDTSSQPLVQTYTTHESWSANTMKMHNFLDRVLTSQESISYEQVVQGKKRKTVAQSFFELLVLKTGGFIDVQQEEPFGDIHISKTTQFQAAADVL
jgi:Conserved region of Rad21 / Rec8 like protein